MAVSKPVKESEIPDFESFDDNANDALSTTTTPRKSGNGARTPTMTPSQPELRTRETSQGSKTEHTTTREERESTTPRMDCEVCMRECAHPCGQCGKHKDGYECTFKMCSTCCRAQTEDTTCKYHRRTSIARASSSPTTERKENNENDASAMGVEETPEVRSSGEKARRRSNADIDKQSRRGSTTREVGEKTVGRKDSGRTENAITSNIRKSSQASEAKAGGAHSNNNKVQG